MISVCYLIVCTFNLLYFFDQAVTFSTNETRNHQEHKYFFSKLTVENQNQFLANMVTPYYNLTYDEQLDKKQNRSSRFVDKIIKRSKKFEPTAAINMPQLLQIIPSPVATAYRNKDLFKCWFGVDRKSKTVGLTIEGENFSIRPKDIVTIKETHKRVAQVFEDFIRLSPLPATLKLSDRGHWRSLLIRSNEAGDIMTAVTVQPKDYTSKTILDQQQALKEYFFKYLPNITLFHQQCHLKICTHNVAPFSLLYGKPYLMETINGYEFKILPGTLFPGNKLGAEVLYNTTIRLAKLKPNTTLLELYSGTGIVSIMASKFVKEVIGIDNFSETVLEARANLKLNNIPNVKFVMGKIDKLFESVLQRLGSTKNLVVIMKPGNDRFGWNVVRTIHRTPQISKVLYLDTCKTDNNPKNIQNFIALFSNRTSNFPPFRLTKVIPVDVFPQTALVEVILVFERLPSQ